MDESQLIRQAQKGDSTAFGELFKRYNLQAFRTAYLVTQDRHLAEDMTQEAFVRAFQAIAKCDPARPFAPWLMRILINLCRTANQRRGRQVTLAEVPESSAPDPGYADAEARVQVWQVLQKLDPLHRDVLMLRYYHDFSDAEIAEALDIPLGTAKSRLHTARRLVEQQFAERLGPTLDVTKEVYP